MNRQLSATLCAAAALAACSGQSHSTIPEARVPQYSVTNTCTSCITATPSPDPFAGAFSYSFDMTAMYVNRTLIPTGAVSCKVEWVDENAQLFNCYDSHGNLLSTQQLVQIGTIIPSPQHPGCFFAGVINGGAILAPVQVVLQLIGLGKIALNPWPNLAWYIGNGIYKTYTGC